MGQKTSFFHEASKVEGVFTSNRFVSMIRCSKHFWGTCFHPNILMSSHLLNWREIFFEVLTLFIFLTIFTYIFFTKNSCKFEKSNLRGIYFQNKIFSWLRGIWKIPKLPLQDRIFRFFIFLLVMKIFCFENKSHEA